MKILSEMNRCLLCLKKGHAKANCRMSICCEICKNKHNKLVCTKSGEAFNKKGNLKENSEAQGTPVNSSVLTVENKQVSDVLLMKADVIIEARSRNINAVALFDTGATVNFITDEKIEKLKLKKFGKVDLDILPFMQKEPIRVNTARFLLKIRLLDGSIEEIMAYKIKKDMMPTIRCANMRTGKIEAIGTTPDLLISMRHFWRFFKSVVPISDYLFKVETTVGPIICGDQAQGKLVKINENVSPLLVIGSKTVEKDNINNFWNLESIGVRDDPQDKDDQIALNFFQKSVRRLENGRYMVKWPWKCEKFNLPSNFGLSYKRFLGLLEKLRKMPELIKEYEKIIKEDLEKGILEITDRKEGGLEHFLPHHPVISPKKIRIVYDASARMRGGKSLNDCLYRGPIIMPDLAGLLIRFRIPRIAMWSDIEKAFHSLELDLEDREVVKLIWLKDINKPVNEQNIQYLRFARVPFGIISSPFLLSATVRHHLGVNNDPIAEKVKNNSYVDNILFGADTTEEAWEAYKRLQKYI